MIKLKMTALCLMTAAALLSAGVAAASFAKPASETAAACFAEPEKDRYVLRDYEGYVAVFVENDPRCPMTVTDIQVSTLRELDKRLLRTGMKIDSHQRLMMTLEDLNS